MLDEEQPRGAVYLTRCQAYSVEQEFCPRARLKQKYDNVPFKRHFKF